MFLSSFLPPRKERHRPTILEVVFNLLVAGTEHLDTQLIQRVVVAAANTHRPPRIATLHLPGQTTFLSLMSVGFLLCLVFQLKQQALLL